jgi:DNA-binding LytR/AlgR family response regulator
VKINCLAVDDEPMALNLIVDYIGRTPFLHLAGRCGDAYQALERLEEVRVDLIFLDIHMPGMSGVNLARTLEPGPRVIFTTAYEEYALQGFQVDALDYLLKPISYEEFLKAAYKAKASFELVARASQAQTPPRVEPVEENCLFVKSEYSLIRISLDDILYIEGFKDYVKIYTAEKAIMSLLSLKALDEKLPEHRFMRVHRSYIVALDKISTITNNHIIFDKVNIPVGSQYKDAFYGFIHQRSL